MIWLVALALAQEPAPADTDAGVGTEEVGEGEVGRSDDGTYEVIVHGDLMVERKRQAVLAELEQMGFTEHKDKGDYVVMHHEQVWKGEVWVYDDGWVRMKRRPLHFVGPEMPWARENSPLAIAGCVIYPWLCVRPGGVLVGRRKLKNAQARFLSEMEPELQDWGDALADRSTEETVNDLPQRLYALWEEGAPLTGDALLPTPAGRRRALFDFWASRTDTEWGDEVRVAVEAFIRAEVQSSPFPFTEAELTAWQADAPTTRVLMLDRTTTETLAAYGLDEP